MLYHAFNNNSLVFLFGAGLGSMRWEYSFMALWRPCPVCFMTMDGCGTFSSLFTSPETLGESHETEVIKQHPKIPNWVSFVEEGMRRVACLHWCRLDINANTLHDVVEGECCLALFHYSFSGDSTPCNMSQQPKDGASAPLMWHNTNPPEQAAVLWPPHLSCVWSLRGKWRASLGSARKRESLRLQLPPSAGAPLIIVMDGEGKG